VFEEVRAIYLEELFIPLIEGCTHISLHFPVFVEVGGGFGSLPLVSFISWLCFVVSDSTFQVLPGGSEELCELFLVEPLSAFVGACWTLQQLAL
jgi:hypothetical protein